MSRIKNTNSKKIFLSFFLFFPFIIINSISFVAFTQGQVSLKVLDEDNEIVEFANLRLFTPKDSTVISGGYSSETGKISIEDIPFGDYYGIITFFGYDDYWINDIHLSSNHQKVNLGTIHLQKIKSQEFEEVVVMGRETKMMETSIDKRTYNVEKDITTEGGDLTDILNNIPSVEVDNDGNISLRGSGSVTILIDGRESLMTSGEGALNGIPASSIERIELVTNPSAKYNPEGTAGIINIVLKKKKLRGFNTNVQLTAASQNLYNGSMGLNLRREKFNFHVNYSFRYDNTERIRNNERESSYNDTLEFLNQIRIGSGENKSHTGNIGFDYYINEKQVIGLGVSGTVTNQIDLGKQNNELGYNSILNNYWEREINEAVLRNSVDLNTNYKLDFKENAGNFSVAAFGSIGGRDVGAKFEEYYFHPNGTPLSNNYRYQNQDRTRDFNRFTLNMDLVKNINEKKKIEIGAESKFSNLIETNHLESYDTLTGEIIPITNFNNRLIYNERIFSAYGIYGQAVTDWFKYQVGLRAEQAFIEPRFEVTEVDYSYDYFSLYPSAHIVFSTKSKNTENFFISYSRRVNRPSMWNLNPFPFYDDPLNIMKGNPALLPEYINSYELGYERDWQKFNLMSTIYFRQTVDKIQRITQFYDDGTSVSTFENIDESYDYGFELIGIYSPFSWWRNVISFNAYESRVAANINGIKLNNRGISYVAKINSTFSVNNTTNIQINGQYVSPRYTVQGIFQFNPGIDAGATRSFLDKKMVIGLKVSDIFNQRGFYVETSSHGITQKRNFSRTSRRLYLTFSYNFGNITSRDKPKQQDFQNSGGGDDAVE